jgi:ATP-dependent Clp protease adapter protein ClpS
MNNTWNANNHEGRRAKGEGREMLFTLRPSPLAPHLSVFAQAVVSPYEDEDVLIDDDIGTRIGEPWKVILYNDDIHTFDEVILQLQKALKCSAQRAEKIAFEAHTRGKAIAFSGEFDECFRVAGVLREIQLIVEIEG